MDSDFRHVDRYPNLPPEIARERIHHHFPWLTPGAMKNYDWKGEGPEGAFKIGKKIIYPTAKLLEWLDSRMVPPTKKSKKKSLSTSGKDVPRQRSRGRKRKEQEVCERRGRG